MWTYFLWPLLIAAIIPAVVFAFRKLSEKKDTEAEATEVYAKKYESADIQKYGIVLGNIGLVVSLLLIIWAFEFKIYDEEPIVIETADIYTDEVVNIPVTTVPPPPKVQIRAPEIIEVEEEPEEDEVELVIEEEPEEEPVYGPPVEGPVGPPGPPPAPEPEVEDKIFMVVEDQPEPPGGMGAFMGYLAKNIKYPAQAKRLDIQGRVFVQFVVSKTGELTDIKVVKGIGGGCDEEAVRVLQAAPKWKPGKQRGRPVKVNMTIPVRFKLS